MTPCETMLYWPHSSALVAYNGGTSVGHGPMGTVFLEPDFVLWGAVRNWQLYILSMYCKSCIYFHFSIFPYNLHDLPQKKITRHYHKKILFFYNSHDLLQKKLHSFTAKKLHD